MTETLVVTSPNGERSFTATYTTDGKAITQQVMGRDAQTTAKWEGDVLVISFSDERGGFARKIALSPDGKTMTIAARQTNENGARDETLILEKQ